MSVIIESLIKKTNNIKSGETIAIDGKVSQVVGLVIEATGPQNAVGSLCNIHAQHGKKVRAEIVGFKENKILLMPLDETIGIVPGARVTSSPQQLTIPVGLELKGRVLDGLGNPIDDLGKLTCKEKYPVFNTPPNPLKRKRIKSQLSTGIRSIDGLIPIANGQRVGIFAGSGVGKSVTMGMIARNTSADINVIALIGERGREVREFIENDLGEEGMKRSILVVATSDQAPYIRLKASLTATAIAEYFRDKGMNVMLMMDSLTRVAQAQREVGLAVGEAPTSKGYTPSVFALLPRLLERAGTNSIGTISGLYSVLVEGDDLSDPVADSARSILDGHIVLSRNLANKGHYPSIDVLKSVSRLKTTIAKGEKLQKINKIIELISVFNDSEDLINIGAYAKGSNPSIDLAIKFMPVINQLLRQQIEEKTDLNETLDVLSAIFEKINSTK
ncbi:MAG: EscN/YscN/HrcN family type III secretion system ATPase [Candidatus Marinimicrobia bacterium]|nr:EscN/YscN/HrcN family type III secretion system ATPase [Candidatus Neomarinimicrobiota bacterium]|tara:strand:- start:4649 stop:5983 length:1335 start_codon:yes stop_codon:yes gene_type:complete